MTDTVISTPVVSKQPDPEKELQDVRSRKTTFSILDFSSKLGAYKGFERLPPALISESFNGFLP